MADQDEIMQQDWHQALASFSEVLDHIASRTLTDERAQTKISKPISERRKSRRDSNVDERDDAETSSKRRFVLFPVSLTFPNLTWL